MTLFLFGAASILALIAISIFISLSEISFAVAREMCLRSLAEQGDSRAQTFLKLRRNSGQVITVLQICLNAVGVLGGVVSSELLTPAFSSVFMQLGVSNDISTKSAAALSFVLVTGLFVLFADLLPKGVAINDPDRIALRMGVFLTLALKLLYPAVWLFTKISDFLLGLLRIPAASTVQNVTEEDLNAILAAGTASGALLKQEHQLIQNVLALQDRSVTSAMTPRGEIVFLDVNEGIEKQRDKVRAKPYSLLFMSTTIIRLIRQ